MAAAFPVASFAQLSKPNGHLEPGGTAKEYLFPINPGQDNFLAGTMGELRSTHFHGGIDIKTNNRIGVPVLATQDGYIMRAHISTGGYGTALYLAHPDGRTSVYGHLERLNGKVGALATKEQYRRKSFEINLDFRPGEFTVKRGDTIAFSGNTGSSQGPHLHFEIREGTHVLNPLKFGFSEVKDGTPPYAQKIALRTLDMDARINDRFGRFEFTVVKKSNSEYVLPVPILAHGHIGVELLAYDRMDGSNGKCGINYITVFVDSQQVFSQVIEKVDLEESRGILAVMDYKALETRGKLYNKLYLDEGNRLGFYESENEGVVSVRDQDRNVRISLKDESGNESSVRFQLRRNPVTEDIVLPTHRRNLTIESDLLENILTITSRTCEGSDFLTMYHQGKQTEIAYSYKGANQRYYLIDLRHIIPDSVKTCAGSLAFQFKDIVPSTTDYTYYSNWADVRFPERALFDTLFLNVNHRIIDGTETFTIGRSTFPLHRRVQVVLKPTLPVPAAKNRAVYRNGWEYIGGDWNGGKVRFHTQELGEFTFRTDSVRPILSRIRLDRESARFRTRDALSGIVYYEATIDGQWLLMSYDFKSGILQSVKLDPKQPLKGDFELKVVDRAGNETIFKQKIL